MVVSRASTTIREPQPPFALLILVLVEYARGEGKRRKDCEPDCVE